MKNQNFLLPSKKGISYKNLLQIFVVLLITAFDMSRLPGRNIELTGIADRNSLVLLPDSIFEDTTTIEYTLGDTIEILTDGLDSVFILYEDSAFTVTDSLTDTPDDMLRAVNNTLDIKINLGGHTIGIIESLFGICAEGMFQTNHTPIANPYNPDAWDWMSELAPKTLRFPGGASTTYMHFLPYKDEEEPSGVLDTIKGYGYDIKEIIRYYDITDSVVQANIPAYMTYILDDLEDEVCDSCFQWMNFDEYQTELERNYAKWIGDQANASGPNQRYLDQFIRLIDTIQTKNPGHIVNVILDLNILSETAGQCKYIIQYMRDSALNGITDVNVVGVEMGNEMYFERFDHFMGFKTFGNYWSYINGGNTSTFYTDNFKDYVWSDSLKNDHNYIQELKGSIDFNVKISLPADNLPYNTAFVFKGDGKKRTPDWNTGLTNANIYGATINVGHSTRYKFDAVSLHQYNEGDENWEHIPLENLCVLYPNDTSCSNYFTCTDPPGSNNWQDTINDTRLKPAFEGMLGNRPHPPTGNIQDMIKYEFMESFDTIRTIFKFTPSATIHKELWITEFNLKSQHNSLPADSQKVVDVYHNTFPHALLLQEWWLKNMKLNNDPDFYTDFLQYTTYHNWGGGGASSLLYHADMGDYINHIPELDPADFDGQNYWMRRATYYVMELLSVINKKELNYLPSNFTMHSHNPNIQPTVFIDPGLDTLYVFVTNMKEETQSIIINPHDLINLYPDSSVIGFGEVTINAIDAKWSYSNSGKGAVYDINTCYNDSSNLHPFEIQGISYDLEIEQEVDEGLPSGAIGVTIPGFSVGYFTVAIEETPRKGSYFSDKLVSLYPNPTGSKFRINNKMDMYGDEIYEVDIYSITNVNLMHAAVKQNQEIEVSNLPSGIYLVNIKMQNVSENPADNITITKKLIKID